MVRTPDGSRTLAKVPGDDAEQIGFLTDGSREPVGSHGWVVRDGAGDQFWRCGRQP
jgi:acetyl-CoA C-acetyltransferase